MTSHKLPSDDSPPSVSPRNLLDARPTDDDIECDSETETLVGLECGGVTPSRPRSPTASHLSGDDEAAGETHAKKPYSLYQTNLEARIQSPGVLGLLAGRHHTSIIQPGSSMGLRRHRPYGQLSEEELRNLIEEIRRCGRTARSHADHIE